MKTRIPELNRKDGVHYAETEEGVELPVIDISHPAFSLETEKIDVFRLREQLQQDNQRWERSPRWMQHLFLLLLKRQSILMRGLLEPDEAFLSGMNTYLMKLGPDNLGKGYTRRLDPKIAASVQGLGVRLRLQHTARLIADGLCKALPGMGDCPLHLINIAGGPALDTLNALILLHKEHPSWLAGRPIRIQVLDPDRQGPGFGARALQALRQAGAPLQGLCIDFERVDYDWNRPEALSLGSGDTASASCAAGSSEGGLFEYGSDPVISANLQRLHAMTPQHFSMTGSILMDTALTRNAQRLVKLPLRRFSPQAFAALVEKAGWRVDASLEGPTICCVRLAKQA